MSLAAPPAPRTRGALHTHPPAGAPGLARRAGVEALAAFALVFAGCGAAITNAEHDGALGTVGIGLIIMVMIYASGHLSGAHINPGWCWCCGAFRRGGRFSLGGR